MMSGFGRPEIVRLVRARRVWARWSEVVGEALATKCAPSRFATGTLWIKVSGASWAQEMRMQKKLLLAKLNAIENVFEDLRFEVGSVDAQVVESDAVHEPIEPEEVDVQFKVAEFEEVGRRVLGKMKALSRKRNVEES